MRALAVIPARAGSKRLPEKNTRSCAGVPLLVWSIRSVVARLRLYVAAAAAVSTLAGGGIVWWVLR